MHTARTKSVHGNTPTMELLRPAPRARLRRSSVQSIRPSYEIEDAVFETVGPTPQDAECVYGAPEGMFTPIASVDDRMDPAHWQGNDDAQGSPGRLDLFSGKSQPLTGNQARGAPIAGPAFLTGVVLIAAALFWMTGGHELLADSGGAPDPLMTSTVPVGERVSAGSVALIDMASPLATNAAPLVTKDRPGHKLQRETDPASAKALPARIERAGSILMIRSGS